MDPDTIDAELLRILKAGHPGKGTRPRGLTTYQVLNRMEPALYKQATVNGIGGQGNGSQSGLVGSQVVQRGMGRLVKKGLVDYVQVDGQGISFDVKQAEVRSGYPVTTFYFLT